MIACSIASTSLCKTRNSTKAGQLRAFIGLLLVFWVFMPSFFHLRTPIKFLCTYRPGLLTTPMAPSLLDTANRIQPKPPNFHPNPVSYLPYLTLHSQGPFMTKPGQAPSFTSKEGQDSGLYALLDYILWPLHALAHIECNDLTANNAPDPAL